MAQPFQVQEGLGKLLVPYPAPEEFRSALADSSRRSREHMVRLWLTEGTPFVFRGCPGVYEEIRRWLGTRLDVCPKGITIVGSARIGFSLAAGENFGHQFGDKSDLDLAVVSERLFEAIAQTFSRWKYDYTHGLVRPRNDREKEFWDENLQLGENSLRSGFFDTDKLPTFDRYPLVQQIQNTMWALRVKLQATPNVLLPRRASVRTYRAWRDLVARVSFNLQVAIPRS